MIRNEEFGDKRSAEKPMPDANPATRSSTPYSNDEFTDDLDKANKFLASGDGESAITVITQQLSRLGEDPNPNDLRPILARTLLASAYEIVGKPDEAARCIEYVLSKVVGTPLEAHSDLGSLYFGAGKLWLDASNSDKAIVPLTKSNHLRPEYLRGVPNLEWTVTNLLMAQCALLKGDEDNFGRLVQKSLTHFSQMSEDDRVEVIPAIHLVAKELVDHKRHNDAENLLRFSLKVLEGITDETSQVKIATLDLLAFSLYQQGKSKETISMFRQQLDNIENTFGRNSEVHNRYRASFANILRQCGNADEACSLLKKRAYEAGQASLDGTDPTLFSFFINAAQSCLTTGQFRDATDFYKLAKGSRISPLSPEKVEFYLLEAKLAGGDGKLEKVERSLRKGLEIIDRLNQYDEKPSQKVTICLSLANLLTQKGESEEAQSLIDTATSCIDDIDSLIMQTLVRVQLLSIRGDVAVANGDMGTALGCFDKAIEICREQPILSKSGSLSSALVDSAEFDLHFGKNTEALLKIEEAWSVLPNKDGGDRANVSRILRALIEIREANSDTQGAKEARDKLAFLKFEIGFMNDRS